MMKRVLALCFCLLLTGTAAQARQETAMQRTPSGNAYLAGSNFRVLDPVAGDLIAAGGRVSVEAPVAEDAILAGGSVDMRAPVLDDLRVAGGTVTVIRDVGGDLVAAGGDVRVENGVSIGGAAWLAGSDVRLGGKVAHGVEIYAGDIEVSADIAGNARLVGQQIVLAPGARIGGNLYYASRTPPQGLDPEQVAGKVVRLETPDRWDDDEEEERGPEFGWINPIFLVSMFVFGVILYLLFPTAVAGVAATLRTYPWRSLLLGFALLFTIPPLAVLAMVTIIGLPLGFALLLLYPLLLLLGYLATAFFVSRAAAGAMRQSEPLSRGKQILFLALALILLSLALAIPFLGPIVFIVATVIGAGSLVTWAYLRARPPQGS